MQNVIQVAKKDSAKAWGVLIRTTPGHALPNRTFIVDDRAIDALRTAGVKFKLLS